jgi:hypothetical protein
VEIACLLLVDSAFLYGYFLAVLPRALLRKPLRQKRRRTFTKSAKSSQHSSRKIRRPSGSGIAVSETEIWCTRTLYYHLNAVVCYGRRLRAGEARDHHRSLQHRAGSHEYHKTCPRLRRCRLSSLPSTRSHGDSSGSTDDSGRGGSGGDSSLAKYGVVFFGTFHQGSKMAGFIDCITQAGIAYDPTVSTPRGGSFGPTSTNSSSSSVKAMAFGASKVTENNKNEIGASSIPSNQPTFPLQPTPTPDHSVRLCLMSRIPGRVAL